MNPKNSSPIISVKNINKKLGRKSVLNNLCFDVNSGDIVAVLGPNGAGKTTLLRVLATLMRVDCGDVRIADRRLPDEATAIRKMIGFVSHQPLLYGELTAVENLRFYGRLYNLVNMDERIETVLNVVGLTGRRNDLVRTYSRGMQQRLSLGRAILHEPSILLFDEPFNGLDQEACETFAKYVSESSTNGRTVVMASHDLAGMEKLASRFDILVRGQIVASVQRALLPKGKLSSVYRNTLQSFGSGDLV